MFSAGSKGAEMAAAAVAAAAGAASGGGGGRGGWPVGNAYNLYRN